MVRPDQDGVLGPLQPVPPLLQGRVDGEEFSVAPVVVLLGWGELSGEEGDRVNLLVPLSMLGQDGSDAHVRRIHLDDELSVGVGEDEHRSRGEEGLEGDESGLCLFSPGEGAEGGGKCNEWGGHPAEPSDEPAVKVSKPLEPPELGLIRGPHPLFHRMDLLRVSPDLPPLQDVAKKLHGGGVEHAFLGLHIQPVLQQAVEYL